MSAVHDAHLNFQLGEYSPFSELFYYDPSGVNQEIYGIYIDGSYDGGSDSGHVQRKDEERKILMASKPDFDIYDDKKIKRNKTGKEHTIRMTDIDDSGFYILYL